MNMAALLQDDTFQKAALAVLGFFLTTFIGGLIGFWLNRRLWQTQTKHLVFKATLDEGTKFLDELSELVGRRFFALQRLFWAIETQNVDRIGETETAYFETVKEWNARYWRSRNKIRLLLGDAQADSFLDYEDDRSDKPRSLHYVFVVAHRALLRAKEDSTYINVAKRYIMELNWACSVFLEKITTDFLSRATALQLLEVPTGQGAAELHATAKRQQK